MGDDWRVCILFGDLPGQLTADQVYTRYPASAKEAAEQESFRQALISAMGSRLGDQVRVSLSSIEFILEAPSAGSADEAAQVAREVLLAVRRQRARPDRALEPVGRGVAGCDGQAVRRCRCRAAG